MSKTDSQQLVEKYDVPAPRYTSYPTVPYWNKVAPSQADWKLRITDAFSSTNASEGISIYIHLPFCESLCTYCGCNTRITVNHKVEQPYLTAVLEEWKLYLDLFDETPRIREIHLGGGTPTFFSAENLRFLMDGILEKAVLCEDAELSFEGHPDNTTVAHLETLNKVGFTRISFGIQDFDEKVQRAIHRFQTYDTVQQISDAARLNGYDSINFDLVYGLPLQNLDTIVDTVEKVIALRPDRIAFYSYAHVPWVKPGQRSFTEADLPDAQLKRTLYQTGRAMLLEAGYREIGMDHFALPHDGLYQAFLEKQLHRNFMGYAVSRTSLLIGLGVSSISDTWNAFAQNEKKIEDYYQRIDAREFPFFKGHLLTDEDLVIREQILEIMCKQETSWNQKEKHFNENDTESLKELEADGLIELTSDSVKVTEKGLPFLRNICMVFDAKLSAANKDTSMFSKSI